jgi:hypothetical protein
VFGPRVQITVQVLAKLGAKPHADVGARAPVLPGHGSGLEMATPGRFIVVACVGVCMLLMLGLQSGPLSLGLPVSYQVFQAWNQ